MMQDLLPHLMPNGQRLALLLLPSIHMGRMSLTPTTYNSGLEGSATGTRVLMANVQQLEPATPIKPSECGLPVPPMPR